MPTQRWWRHLSKYDAVFVLGLLVIVQQVVRSASDLGTADPTIVGAGIGLVALGLGLRIDQKNGGAK